LLEKGKSANLALKFKSLVQTGNKIIALLEQVQFLRKSNQLICKFTHMIASLYAKVEQSWAVKISRPICHSCPFSSKSFNSYSFELFRFCKADLMDDQQMFTVLAAF